MTLISHEKNIKLCDFGCAVLLDDQPYITENKVVGSLRWLAHEIFCTNTSFKYTFSTDTYAFLLVIYELITTFIPFDGSLFIDKAISNDLQIAFFCDNTNIRQMHFLNQFGQRKKKR